MKKSNDEWMRLDSRNSSSYGDDSANREWRSTTRKRNQIESGHILEKRPWWVTWETAQQLADRISRSISPPWIRRPFHWWGQERERFAETSIPTVIRSEITKQLRSCWPPKHVQVDVRQTGRTPAGDGSSRRLLPMFLNPMSKWLNSIGDYQIH